LCCCVVVLLAATSGPKQSHVKTFAWIRKNRNEVGALQLGLCEE